MIGSTALGYTIVSLISFILGAMVGWILATELNELEAIQFRRAMAVVILSIYIVSVMAEISLEQYQTPMLLHAIMGGIVGYLFSQGAEGFNINIGQD